MLKIPVHDNKGNKIDEIELNANVFTAPINESALHYVVVAQRAAERQGSASTKTRGEVRGGGKKPWKQKGTGRARAGSSRSPIWKGGGTVFGPSPRKYDIKTPKKLKNLALRSALSLKINESELIVLDKIAFEKPKTKEAIEILKNIEANDRVVLVINEDDKNASMSFRNLDGVKVISVNRINVYDILNNDTIVFSREALKKVAGMLI
ncbi:MAG: 50S ribosomal protein L4 [Actinobacteria bacterium]|nr:50S ribosomal protein L4 [Actinomycetota bacterium]